MIHFFNPGHEAAVLNQSPYYTPSANVVVMQSELAFLPAWYAQEGDSVWLNTTFDIEYISSLKHFFDFNIDIVNEFNIKQFSDENVCLWGISPQAIHFFKEINQTYNINLGIPKWHDEFVDLNSRFAAKECLKHIIKVNSHISTEIVPPFYSSLEDIEKIVIESSYRLLAKAPYSSSGRGLLWLPSDGLTRTERQILHGILKKQKRVSIEKVLNKQLDFAMEFMADGNGEIAFAGYSLFTTTDKGGYTGNILTSQKKIETAITNYISVELLSQIQETLIQYLSLKIASIYRGCIGIDMMIYQNEAGEYKLQPCLEINMRYNMGFLALRLFENYINPLSEGRFLIEFSSKEGEIYQKHIQYLEQYPIITEHKKIAKGYLNLAPVNENSKYWAYILID